ncbi:MAG: phosphoribosylglycinamide formyltransferase [Crocinitomicaceae bacterium]|nr:phosphoribosylglycinamide formyltransferase [Crocinitomicaceae bacterium]MBK8927779.1 phosphoribosylglycinamide formyltransferase [Crocinitomicaceae bacterium]
MIKKHIVIFASGGGSNAEVIMRHFKNHPKIDVVLVVSNNPKAGVLHRADSFGVPCYVYQSAELENGIMEKTLQAYRADFIVLAGYLKKIPDSLIKKYNNRMVNIHPALLPKFGGKGMYGMNVHKAVVAAGENKSGITIHYVNEYYDEGAIIEQHEVEILPTDSAERVSQKVLELEHEYFAPCIENIVLKLA